MKTKHAIILFVLGYCFEYAAVLFKISHKPSADTILIIGAVLKISGALLFLYKLLTYPKIRNFLNS